MTGLLGAAGCSAAWQTLLRLRHTTLRRSPSTTIFILWHPDAAMLFGTIRHCWGERSMFGHSKLLRLACFTITAFLSLHSYRTSIEIEHCGKDAVLSDVLAGTRSLLSFVHTVLEK